MKAKLVSLMTLAPLVAACAARAAEEPYEFRTRLEAVHQSGLRDVAATRAADEIALGNGCAIAVPDDAGEVLVGAARDFVEYLDVSMGVDARVARHGRGIGGAAVRVAIDATLPARSYEVEVADDAAVRAADERAAAQALYHLEDLMNLRRAPFLRRGKERRRAVFETRMVHSGYATDVFPDEHLNAMAHAGMTAVIVFLEDVDKTKGAHDGKAKCAVYQDVKALIRRAKRYGLDTYLYSYVLAFKHPDDPDAETYFADTYGRIAGHYPEAKGVILVGESCQFPSKDPRVRPLTWQQAKKIGGDDTRPLAGWFPCTDYPDWLKAVKRAIHARAPEMELVFWTYNWGWAPVEDRMRLIDALPLDVTMMATFEMFERQVKRTGLECPTADYTLSFAGPGKYFVSEAVRAKRRGLKLATQAMSGGLTWDFGSVPYQPCPHQWRRRWDALVKAHGDWGLAEVMENHHNGWWPSFIAELEKEAFTEGGMPFEEHLAKIAARDYGAANAEKVVAVWKAWSDSARDYVSTDVNQYGPFRIGPAYPFAFGDAVPDAASCPVSPRASNGIGICRLDYLSTKFVPSRVPERTDPAYMRDEIALFEPMMKGYEDGERLFASIPGERAARMANFAGYLAACVRTAINVKRGAIAFLEKDDAGFRAAAKAEYENAANAIRYVENDSRLGWEPTMEYGGGAEMIRWKLRLMEKAYGCGR